MSKPASNAKTLTFIFVLCLVSALLLAVLATALRSPQLRAKELDQAKQMLAAAEIYNLNGYFQLEGKPAKFNTEKGNLDPSEEIVKATADEIYAIFQKRLKPYLTNAQGDVSTFAAQGIDIQEYIDENQVAGYYKLPWKLFYAIKSNGEGQSLEGYIIPVAGFGLWGPIFGYLALESNADTVIGTTWSAPMETPGLGAIITETSWQDQFAGKEIFLPSGSGETNFANTRLGLTVVKGKVSDVFGKSPRAQTAVDGITGATLTCDGVTAAYNKSLAPYRPFLIKANEANTKGEALITDG